MLNKLKIFKNKKIIVTGFNGFKGTWLSIWLNILGAKVYGISLKNNEKNNHYNLIKKYISVKEHYIDIRNFSKLDHLIKKIKPDFVFHLAAQALVSKSIRNPKFNWETNVIGFFNIIHSLSNLKNKCSAVLITSDKCYKNFEKKTGYKESDILGGVDPYSASKASAEILFHSYYKNFIEQKNRNLRVVTARAGNVVGGGDWSADRLIPDCMRNWLINKPVNIRNPNSTRPWQHVLEALYGYLMLAEKLHQSNYINGQSFNFSSDKIKNITVINFLKKIKKYWSEIEWKIIKSKKFYESGLLQLNNNKAKKILNWSAQLKIDETVFYLVEWYLNYKKDRENIFIVSRNQILKFHKKLK